MIKQQACWKALSIELGVAGIHVLEPDLLKAEELRWLEDYFLEQVFPVLTPLAIDPAHPFTFIPNLGFAMVMQMRRLCAGRSLNALLTLPSQVDRCWCLPGAGGSEDASDGEGR